MENKGHTPSDALLSAMNKNIKETNTLLRHLIAVQSATTTLLVPAVLNLADQAENADVKRSAITAIEEANDMMQLVLDDQEKPKE